MIEAGANEVDEDTMLNAIKAAHVEIKKIIDVHQRDRGRASASRRSISRSWAWIWTSSDAIQDKYLDDFKAAMDTDDKNVRDAALLPIMDKIAEEYPDLSERRPSTYVHLQDAEVRRPPLAAR